MRTSLTISETISDRSQRPGMAGCICSSATAHRSTHGMRRTWLSMMKIAVSGSNSTLLKAVVRRVKRPSSLARWLFSCKRRLSSRMIATMRATSCNAVMAI